MKIKLLCIFSLLFFKNQFSYAQTWTPIDPRTPYNVSAVYFLNDSVGFISGGIWSGPFGINNTFLKKTIDRGQHFTIVFDSSGMTPINQLYFYSEQYGLLKRWQDVINVTHDGGQSDSALVVTGCSSSGSYFQILDSNTIYLYEPNCNGKALGMSIDNGQTWTYNSAMSSIGANLTGNFLNQDTNYNPPLRQ